jgi:tRNA pseudouridine55 synthase
MKSEINNYSKPLIFNCYKPEGSSSFDVVRHFKRSLPKGYGKIGHFGTLDPFACGVLMIGVNGAAKLNNYIHDFLPKSYIATGVLGLDSETGDLTEGHSQEDTSEYLNDVISKFDIPFIQKTLREKFLGEYMQAPHVYSAAKHEGMALHKWVRKEGIKIQKEKKQRHVYEINVVSYEFPKLIIEFKVSSGTYIRTLFKECANTLGTLGTLSNLERNRVGGCSLSNTIDKEKWPVRDESWDIDGFGMDVRDVLDFSVIIFEPKEANLYSNGVKLKEDRALSIDKKTLTQKYWVEDENNNLLGLARIDEGYILSEFNFASST